MRITKEVDIIRSQKLERFAKRLESKKEVET